MRKPLSALILVGALLSGTGVYAQNAGQMVAEAKCFAEFQDQLEAVTDIVVVTSLGGPEEVGAICAAAVGELSLPLNKRSITSLSNKCKDTLANQCLIQFCASGGNTTDLSKSAVERYCIKNN
ncbi:hypothetical protein [Oceaniovalibus guishaninsula]|uniref:hypothetical protein n=1 Tax=Oceaniovalibus guishaninsula TaxID=1046117 RepID=UPI0012E9F47C|nr:hypothetical protein [Oceaniovalibus guishaninsula]